MAIDIVATIDSSGYKRFLIWKLTCLIIVANLIIFSCNSVVKFSPFSFRYALVYGPKYRLYGILLFLR